MKKIKEFSLELLLNVITNSKSYSNVLTKLQVHDNTSNRNYIKMIIKDHNININHFNKRLTEDEYNKNPKYCQGCGKIIYYKDRRNKFCSHSCAAIINNQNNYNICKDLGIPYKSVKSGKYLEKETKKCLNCGNSIPYKNTYCSINCQLEYKRKLYIKRWKEGLETGTIADNDISGHVRSYLKNKHNNQCERCGWHEINPYTGLVPLLIHHKDGNCLNNTENNLELLCPNCHALTENFGSRNKNCTRIDKRIR